MHRLVDSNVWVALAITDHIFHRLARDWFYALPLANRAVFCRSTQQTFLRLLSTPTIFQPYALPAPSNQQAWATYEQWSSEGRVSFVEEPPGLDAQWQILSARPTSSPKLWMDSYLAAFAIAGGYQLVTLDAGFRQFAGLDLVVLGA